MVKKTRNKIFIILLITIISIPTLVKGVNFSDTKNHWSEFYINYMSNNINIVNGYEDGTYRPDNYISRAEVVKLVANYDKKTKNSPILKNTRVPFDVLSGYSWITKEDWERVLSNKYIDGYPDGSFKPEKNITRGEFASIASNLLEKEKKEFPKIYNKFFSDTKNYWSKDRIKYLADRGIIDGYSDNKFYPNSYITRGEVVKILGKINGINSEVNLEGYINISNNLIRLGERESLIISKLGNPDRIVDSPYGTKEYVYNSDLRKFIVIGFLDGKVATIYSNSPSISSKTYRYNQSIFNNTSGLDQKHYKEFSEICFFDTNNQNKAYGILVTNNRIAYDISNVIGYEENMLYDLVNSFRVTKGLSKLKEHNLAIITAKNHSEDMAKKNYFSHVSIDGSTLENRYIQNGGTKKVGVGEVIGAGTSRSYNNFNNYVNSYSHLEILLNPRLTDIGVGMAYDKNSKYKFYNTIVVLINPQNTN